MVRPDHHNEIEFNLLKSKSVTYLLGGSKVRVEANRLSVFWAAIPHQIIEYDTDEPYYAATIPLSEILQGNFPKAFVQTLLRGVLHRDLTNEVQDGQKDLDLFAQWEKDLRNPDPETEEIVTMEMRARLKRLAKHLISRGAKSIQNAGPNDPIYLQEGSMTKAEQMACLIARDFTQPLSVEQLAQTVGLHPNYAMQIFKKAIGSTVTQYLTIHRLSHAQRLLATTQLQIIDVAFQSGFNSLSRFNEAFRKAFGCSPRDYRNHQGIK